MNMRSYAPKISDNIIGLAESIDRQVYLKKDRNGQYNTVLESLIDSWVSGKIVRIQHVVDGEVQETEFAPYFIGFREEEDGRNPISVTGRLRHTAAITTIDIGAITSVVILDETYTIPDNLKPFHKQQDDEVYDSIDFIPLVMKIKAQSAINSFRHINHSTPRFEKNEKGETICRMDAENSIELYLRIIQCEDTVEIIEPSSFKKKFTKLLRKILAIYEESDVN